MRRLLPSRAQSLRRLLTTHAAPPPSGPNHRSIMALDANTIRPFVQPSSFVAPSASVIGSVAINDRSSVMYGTVVRGDLAYIRIGAYTEIGENCMLSAGAVDDSLSPSDAVAAGLSIDPELFIGDYCHVGAGVTLRGCTLQGDNVIGHCCVVSEGAVLERYAMLEPGTKVEDGVEIPEGQVWAGNPARKVRDLSSDEKLKLRKAAIKRYSVTQRHMYEFLPVGMVYLEKEAVSAKNNSKE